MTDALGATSLGMVSSEIASVIRHKVLTEGLPIRDVARQLRLSRNTIRRYARTSPKSASAHASPAVQGQGANCAGTRENDRRQIALHRFQIIEPLLAPHLTPAGRASLMTETIRNMSRPRDKGAPAPVSRRTIQRWLRRYVEADGNRLEALEPTLRTDFTKSRTLSGDALTLAVRVRKSIPHMTVIELLQHIERPELDRITRKATARALVQRERERTPHERARIGHWHISIGNKDRTTLHEWRASNDKRLWQRAVTILENKTLSMEEIAEKIEKPLSRIQTWTREFLRHGLPGIQLPGKRGPRPSTEQQKKRLIQLLHERPAAYDINRASWSCAALALAYQRRFKEPIGTRTVGRMVRTSGYSIRKARKVLSSPDPDYREKVELLLSTLQNLKPGELFFFVDELGPLRVKKYGGRALVRKNEPLTYPQVQAHRGVITMTGALSATANQVTWFYGHAKDTFAMIDLMELLFNQHFTATKLYVTWDAASWHRSTMLVDWLDKFNAETRVAGEGPTIHLVPLPTSSQFLDVLEAVFSGMKRAVVHHSDYPGVPDMKIAISRHFRERNAHFQKNPRRAGKKIWDLDFFDDYDNIRSGNYREW